MDQLLTFAFLSIPLIGAFAMFALGISAIYRASRVLNLAHGAMAMVPAYLNYSLVTSLHVPALLALPIAVASGALLGVGVEWLFVRRLRPQGTTAQTVGTVAVTGLLVAVTAKLYGTASIIAPSVFPDGALHLSGAAVGYGDLGLFSVGLIVCSATFAFFRYTEYGLAMRGAAVNRTAAALVGVDPDRAASVAWALGGGLAALAGVLLAGVTSLDPYTLSLQVLPAFVAALIGGLGSLVGALVGSVVVGLTFGLVPALNQAPLVGSLMRQTGAPQLVLTVVALIAMVVRGQRFAGVEEADAGLTSAAGSDRRGGRRHTVLILVALGLLCLVPLVAPFSVVGSSILAMQYALVAVSLVLLIGWVGQISLAQATFVGLGAFATALAARNLGLGFPVNALVGAAIGMAVAVGLGAIALRVRGLYLAVATLIVAWMGDAFLFHSRWLGLSGGSSTIDNQRIGTAGGFPSFDLTSRTVIFYIVLAVLAAVLVAAANLRDTRTGRAFFAIRGSEVAAASLGIDVVRMKLVAFALSGLLAGLAGGLIMLDQRTVVPGQFLFTVSLQYLAIAVVGGLASLGGAVAAGVLFAALNELFFRVEALSGWLEVVSAGLLAVVLLAYPGGLAAVPNGVRRRVSRLAARWQLGERWATVSAWSRSWLTRLRPAREPDVAFATATQGGPATNGDRGPVAVDWLTAATARPDHPDERGESLVAARDHGTDQDDDRDTRPDVRPAAAGGEQAPAESTSSRHPTGPRQQRTPLLEASGVTVRFGGLTAVDDVSLTVREGEIVGLIGPNGAGKTTLFNAILGLNEPDTGRITLFGRDATDLAPHQRARLGVARTFQVIQLFEDLSVGDNLLVATHLHHEAGLMSNLVAGAATLRGEVAARERVDRVLELLGLTQHAQAPIRDLPFGVLRLVELGRALVTGAPLLMLDEAASGLNDNETDRLMQVVRSVRDLGVTVLLIEHDVRMVTSVSDHLYVLDRGQLIADGPPDEVRNDEQVITAYLGAAQDTQPEPVAS